MYTIAIERSTLHLCAHGKRGDIILPIGITKKLRHDAERGASRTTNTTYIPPQTLERGGRDMFVQAQPDSAGQELKVVRSAYLALGGVFDVPAQGGDLGC